MRTWYIICTWLVLLAWWGGSNAAPPVAGGLLDRIPRFAGEIQQPTRKFTEVLGPDKAVLAVLPEFYAKVHSIKNDCFTLGFSANLEKAKNILHYELVLIRVGKDKHDLPMLEEPNTRHFENFKHEPYKPEQPLKLNQPYITALWEAGRLPNEFQVGDGMHYGGYWNRELTKDNSYVLLVRGAYGKGEGFEYVNSDYIADEDRPNHPLFITTTGHFTEKQTSLILTGGFVAACIVCVAFALVLRNGILFRFPYTVKDLEANSCCITKSFFGSKVRTSRIKSHKTRAKLRQAQRNKPLLHDSIDEEDEDECLPARSLIPHPISDENLGKKGRSLDNMPPPVHCAPSIMVDCASSQSIIPAPPMEVHRLSSKDLRGYTKPVNKYKRVSKDQGIAKRHVRSNQDPDTPRAKKKETTKHLGTPKQTRHLSGGALVKPVGRPSKDTPKRPPMETPKHFKGTPKPARQRSDDDLDKPPSYRGMENYSKPPRVPGMDNSNPTKNLILDNPKPNRHLIMDTPKSRRPSVEESLERLAACPKLPSASAYPSKKPPKVPVVMRKPPLLETARRPSMPHDTRRPPTKPSSRGSTTRSTLDDLYEMVAPSPPFEHDFDRIPPPLYIPSPPASLTPNELTPRAPCGMEITKVVSNQMLKDATTFIPKRPSDHNCLNAKLTDRKMAPLPIPKKTSTSFMKESLRDLLNKRRTSLESSSSGNSLVSRYSQFNAPIPEVDIVQSRSPSITGSESWSSHSGWTADEAELGITDYKLVISDQEEYQYY